MLSINAKFEIAKIAMPRQFNMSLIQSPVGRLGSLLQFCLRAASVTRQSCRAAVEARGHGTAKFEGLSLHDLFAAVGGRQRTLRDQPSRGEHWTVIAFQIETRKLCGVESHQSRVHYHNKIGNGAIPTVVDDLLLWSYRSAGVQGGGLRKPAERTRGVCNRRTIILGSQAGADPISLT